LQLSIACWELFETVLTNNLIFFLLKILFFMF
jgi:hypothetical protein